MQAEIDLRACTKTGDQVDYNIQITAIWIDCVVNKTKTASTAAAVCPFAILTRRPVSKALSCTGNSSTDDNLPLSIPPVPNLVTVSVDAEIF